MAEFECHAFSSDSHNLSNCTDMDLQLKFVSYARFYYTFYYLLYSFPVGSIACQNCHGPFRHLSHSATTCHLPTCLMRPQHGWVIRLSLKRLSFSEVSDDKTVHRHRKASSENAWPPEIFQSPTSSSDCLRCSAGLRSSRAILNWAWKPLVALNWSSPVVLCFEKEGCRLSSLMGELLCLSELEPADTRGLYLC